MSSAESAYFDVDQVGQVTVLHVLGPEIRHPSQASQLSVDALRLVTEGGCRKLLLNMGKVRYLSSTGFATLINLTRKAQEAGGVVKLCNLHKDVEVGANIIGLHRIVETHATEREGLASFDES